MRGNETLGFEAPEGQILLQYDAVTDLVSPLNEEGTTVFTSGGASSKGKKKGSELEGSSIKKAIKSIFDVVTHSALSPALSPCLQVLLNGCLESSLWSQEIERDPLIRLRVKASSEVYWIFTVCMVEAKVHPIRKGIPR